MIWRQKILIFSFLRTYWSLGLQSEKSSAWCWENLAAFLCLLGNISSSGAHVTKKTRPSHRRYSSWVGFTTCLCLLGSIFLSKTLVSLDWIAFWSSNAFPPKKMQSSVFTQIVFDALFWICMTADRFRLTSVSHPTNKPQTVLVLFLLVVLGGLTFDLPSGFTSLACTVAMPMWV